MFPQALAVVAVQTLDKFLEQHAFKRGDYLLGSDYSYAEVATTPFVHRGAAALPTHRGYSLAKAFEQQKAHRFEAWVKVINACHAEFTSLPSSPSALSLLMPLHVHQ